MIHHTVMLQKGGGQGRVESGYLHALFCFSCVGEILESSLLLRYYRVFYASYSLRQCTELLHLKLDLCKP